jgi:lipopolysaccharide exporter
MGDVINRRDTAEGRPPSTEGRLDSRAVRSVPWTLLTYAGNRGVGFIASIVLARLLVPSDFGLIALAGSLTLALNYLRDLGLAATIISRHDLSRHAQGTILTIMICLSIALGLVGVAVAPWVARAFDEADLTDVVRVLSLTICLGGLQGFGEAQLQKHMLFRGRFIVLVGQAVVYSVVAIALAAVTTLGVWSIVIGRIAMSVAGTVLVFVYAAPYWVRPGWNLEEARDALGTSMGFLAQVMLQFLRNNSDYVVVGRYLSAAQVGFYYTSYRLAELPFAAISDPVSRVTFAAFSEMRARGEDIRGAYLSVLRLVAVVSVPLGVVLSTAAEPFTLAVLGEQWAPMVGTLTILGLWASLYPLQNTASWLLNSSGAPGALAKIDAALYLPFLAALVATASGPGIEAVAWAIVAYTLSALGIVWVVCRVRVGIPVKDQIRAVWPAVLACVPAWLIGYGVAGMFDGEPWLGLLATSVACLGCYSAVLSLIDFELVKQSIRQVGRTLGRGRND